MTNDSIFSLQNKVAIITGGYGHLGAGMTKGLITSGSIVIVAGRNKEKFEKIFFKNDNMFFYQTDISSTESIKKTFNEVFNKFGKIDVLVNNAIYSKSNMPEKMTDEEWSEGVEGVLSSLFKCIREVVPYMKKQGCGNIINISSIYGMVSPDFKIYEGFNSFLNPPNYSAAKSGVIQLTKYFASYYAKNNIRVNSISPGAFPSPEVQKHQVFIDNLIKKIPLKKIGTPKDIEGIIVFLASDASSYITGQNIIIDGGWTII